MKKKRLLLLLLLASFLKEIFLLAVIPLWHFPDEEQHFAQLAFWAEKNRFPQGNEFDVNQEINKSSEILGTKRDVRGINKFTYHPEYRIFYTDNQNGLFEKDIKVLNSHANRQAMVKREAARYGPVYYFLAGLPYKLWYQSDLLVRVFSSRLISVFLSTITVFLIYLISKEIFQNELYRLTVVFMVAFQPMFSFVSAGVNSDNLFNLVFTLILYCCLKIFFRVKTNNLRKPDWLSILLLILTLVIGFYTKKQIIISLPIIIFGFLLSSLIKKKKERILSISFLGLIIIVFLVVNKMKIIIPEYDPSVPSKLNESFFQYIFWHFKHTIAETIPWYWGVFNWLGVTLPRWFNRIQSRLLIVCVVGVFVYFVKQIKVRRIFKSDNLKIIFLISAAIIYYLCIIVWDYFFRQSQGFSFGIQGRYFFPTIISHMLIMILGWVTLSFKRYKIKLLKIFNLWWLFYSFVGLYTAVNAYYQILPISIFLKQAAQYKPLILKALGLTIIMILFFISLIIYLINFLRFHEKTIE